MALAVRGVLAWVKGLTGPQLKLAGIAGGIAVVSAIVVGFIAHERQVGKLQALLDSATTAHKIDSLAAIQAMRGVAKALQARDSLAARAKVEIQKDRALAVRTDSAIRAAGDERARALQMLADSLASVGSLRGELNRVVFASQRDSAASAQQRQQDQTTIAALQLTVQSDSTALQKWAAKNALTEKRAADAERQVGLMKSLTPGKVSRLLPHLGAGVAGGIDAKGKPNAVVGLTLGWSM